MKYIKKYLRKNHSLDFDDLIMQTIHLFKRVPEVLEYYQRRFQYIHVDEYQDTNHAQYYLVKSTCKSVFKTYVSSGIRINRFIVGVVQIFEIFYRLKKIIRCKRHFSRTKLSFNKNDFRCSEPRD